MLLLPLPAARVGMCPTRRCPSFILLPKHGARAPLAAAWLGMSFLVS